MAAREVRLGLVLYGGVSLAIYENGNVQEIYRALCGEGLYELLGELIDSDIVVDVISGTSAGGVNGVMLGYSLANGFDFLQSAGLWRELGDIDKLMRKLDDKEDASLLNSTYYQEQLMSCYEETLTAFTGKRVPPAISELDLFVTGTDANGVISTVYDDLGHPIDVKNHRAVFQLQYRGTRKNDFEKDKAVTADQMATLSRLTSGFPVAFKPISIGDQQTDPNFYRWGKLSGPAVYMDGGILNNKPFTSTIGAIASRTATREVERFLIYVEPSPEQFEKPDGDPESPTIVQAGMRSLTSIPSYQSIAADLEAIEAHNERSTQLQKIVESLAEAPEVGKDCLLTATVVPSPDDPCSKDAYLTGRLLLVKDAAVESILNSPGGIREYFQAQPSITPPEKSGKRLVPPVDKRRSGRILVQSFWQWSGDPDRTLVDYDVFFRKRRAGYLTGVLMGALKRDEDPMQVPIDAWEAINHFFKLYEITEWAMRQWLTEWVSGWEGLSREYPELDTLTAGERRDKLGEISTRVWGEAQNRLDLLMTCDLEVPDFGFQSSTALATARETCHTWLRKWMQAPQVGSSPNLLTRLDESLKAAVAALESHGPTHLVGLLLRKEFCRFLEVDRQLLPLQIGSGFSSTDVIRVVRFSPLDAQRGMSKGRVEDKVRGTAMANFGAFFKKSWRANDIMMGRLDAACLLTECLLTKERLTAMATRYRAAGGYTLPAGLIARSLPFAGPALPAQIEAYFADPQPTTAMWEKLIDAIVLAAHKQIVSEEWPQVAKCTLEQQYQWGQYRDESSLPASLNFASKWTPGKASPDDLLVQIAADTIHKGKLPPFDPRTNRHKDFLEEVPLSAMQEHVSLALVRLGKSLIASVPPGKAHDALEGSLLFKATMQWIPGFFYRLVHTRRTQPEWMLVPVAIFLNLALIVVLAFAWMLQQNQHISLTYATLATAGVAAAAVAEWVLLRRRTLSVTIGMVFAILIVSSIGLAAGYVHSNPISTAHDHALRFTAQCLVSIVVIALPSFFPFRSFLLRIAAAALAGLVLLKLIWT